MKKALTLLAFLGALLSASVQAQTAASAPSPAASPRAADKLIAMCIGCHGITGYQASFPEVYKVPKIAGQNAQYIVAALTAYKKGERKHPSMRGIASSLSEQDMNDIAKYYEELGTKDGEAKLPQGLSPQPDAKVQALLAKGVCVSCHGQNLSQPIPGAAKIAGQYKDYLYAALKAYQTEGNPHVGRSNPIMSGQVKPFSHEELKALADYISTLPGELKTVQQSRFR
jgi:cytochrome c553